MNNLKNRKRAESILMGKSLTAEEIEYATQLWLVAEQNVICGSKDFEKMKHSLRLFEDERGLLRLRGRYGNAKFNNDIVEKLFFFFSFYLAVF